MQDYCTIRRDSKDPGFTVRQIPNYRNWPKPTAQTRTAEARATARRVHTTRAPLRSLGRDEPEAALGTCGVLAERERRGTLDLASAKKTHYYRARALAMLGVRLRELCASQRIIELLVLAATTQQRRTRVSYQCCKCLPCSHLHPRGLKT